MYTAWIILFLVIHPANTKLRLLQCFSRLKFSGTVGCYHEGLTRSYFHDDMQKMFTFQQDKRQNWVKTTAFKMSNIAPQKRQMMGNSFIILSPTMKSDIFILSRGLELNTIRLTSYYASVVVVGAELICNNGMFCSHVISTIVAHSRLRTKIVDRFHKL